MLFIMSRGFLYRLRIITQKKDVPRPLYLAQDQKRKNEKAKPICKVNTSTLR